MSWDGTFITVEGIDGSGKTTIVNELIRELGAHRTQEPSEFWTGEQVRKALKEETNPFTDFFLFMADRHHHIEEFILPTLRRGDMVISDRFTDSTRAYQTYQLEEEFNELEQIPASHWIEQVMDPWNIEPDLTLYLDVSVETGLERCDEEEKYEQAKVLNTVRSNYEIIAQSNDRVVRIDAEQEPKEVFKDALSAIGQHLDDQ